MNDADWNLYHYCSVDTLYNMMSSRSLWLTSLRSSNDKKELSTDTRMLDQALSKMINNPEYHKQKEVLEKILEAYREKTYKKYINKENYYGLSFSTEADSLIHWERYGGDHGNGVCIEFNVSMIQYLFKEVYHLSDLFFAWIRPTEIYYKETDLVQSLQAFILFKVNDLLEMFKLNNIDYHLYDFLCSLALAEIKLSSKPNGFCDEREIRITLSENHMCNEVKTLKAILKDDFQDGFKNNFLNILEETNLKSKQYKMIGGMIRSVYAINLEKIWDEKFIKKIILGPRCLQVKSELKLFLNDNNLHKVKIEESKIPLRY